MIAGRLRHRIEIWRAPAGRDSFGQPNATPVLVATARAAVEPLRGREYFAAEQVNAEVDTRIRLRYRGDVLPSDTIRHAGEVYDVKGVVNKNMRNHEIEIMAARVDQ